MVHERQGAHWSRRWPGVVATAIAVVVLAIATIDVGRSWLHWLDRALLGERLIDTWARLRAQEDWSVAEPLGPRQDYAWVQAAGRPMRIAHALGGATTPDANTLGALRRSIAAGIRVLEVDLVSDGDELRCQHDPMASPRLPLDGCTFDKLLAELPSDAWLVLDIKGDFEVIGQVIVNRIAGKAIARRMVFQLYRPSDFALFNRWQRQAALPGPVLTTYLAHRRVDYVARQAERLGIQAFTLPLERLPALGARPVNAAVLVHPIHSCDSWREALLRADGVYTLSSLRCPLPLPRKS